MPRTAAVALLAALVLPAAACKSVPEFKSRQEMRAYDHYAAAPPADPARKVNEQDCTRPVTPDGGNLRCRATAAK